MPSTQRLSEVSIAITMNTLTSNSRKEKPALVSAQNELQMGLMSAFPGTTWHTISLNCAMGVVSACRVCTSSRGKTAALHVAYSTYHGPRKVARTLRQCDTSPHCLSPHTETQRDPIARGNTPVLGYSLLSLEGILCPYSLRVNEFTLPWLDVTIQIWDELVLLMTHS